MAKRRQPSPAQKPDPRQWGGRSFKNIGTDDQDMSPGGIVTGPLAVLFELLGLTADQVAPRTKPQDVELPNKGGWATTDPRIKDHIIPGYEEFLRKNK